MENASKALLMAASIFIALVILSVGIYLINNIQSFSKNYSESIETYKREQFNAQFTSFSGRKNISPHEIVTLLNFANEFNLSNDVEESNAQYIHVKIKYGTSAEIDLTNKNTYPSIDYKNNPNKFISDLLDGTYVYSKYGSGVEKEGQFQYEDVYETLPNGTKKLKEKHYYNCYECKEGSYIINPYTGRVETITFIFNKEYINTRN